MLSGGESKKQSLRVRNKKLEAQLIAERTKVEQILKETFEHSDRETLKENQVLISEKEAIFAENERLKMINQELSERICNLEQQVKQQTQIIDQSTQLESDMEVLNAQYVQSIQRMYQYQLQCRENEQLVYKYRVWVNLALIKDPHRVFSQHWIKDSQVTHCANHSCSKEFGLFVRKHHCRRFPY
jgi:hypothetical protein